MRLIARLKKIEEISYLSQLGVDAFLLDSILSTKNIAEYDLSSIGKIIDEVKKTKKNVYILINKMIHESDLQALDNLLRLLKTKSIDGIVINDLTVYVLAKKYDLDNLIIYQPGTFNTNAYDLKYFDDLQIKGITLSKEITLEEITKISQYDHKIELSLVGHGYIDMFYSKRKLLTNYAIHKNISGDFLKNNYDLRLEEEIRKDQYYPILEDGAGTHIFRSKKLQSFQEMEKLDKSIDELFFERIFIDDKEYYEAIKAYKNSSHQKEFKEKYIDSYDSGFYYQYTEKIKGESSED